MSKGDEPEQSWLTGWKKSNIEALPPNLPARQALIAHHTLECSKDAIRLFCKLYGWHPFFCYFQHRIKSSQIANLLLLLRLDFKNCMQRIFAKSTLREYWETHPDSEQYLETWYDTAMNSEWKSPNDVKQTYANASILKDNRIVFNIKGNSFRLVAKFNFEKQWIFIQFIGTHAAYNKIDANTI